LIYLSGSDYMAWRGAGSRDIVDFLRTNNVVVCRRRRSLHLRRVDTSAMLSKVDLGPIGEHNQAWVSLRRFFELTKPRLPSSWRTRSALELELRQWGPWMSGRDAYDINDCQEEGAWVYGSRQHLIVIRKRPCRRRSSVLLPQAESCC
jgi:hypothetical protein